jgi:hypothetical protein
MWSRVDCGFGVEGLHNENSVKSTILTGKPIEIQIFERSLAGQYKGCLRKGRLVFLIY